MTHGLHDPADVAAAIAETPPDFEGWEFVEATHHQTAHALYLSYVDDDGAVASFALTVTGLDLDERAVRPEPREHEKGDTDL
jgi:hypothetical protein